MILELTIDDIDKLVDLEARLFTKPWTYKQIESEFLNNPFAKFYGIKDGDELACYMAVSNIYERCEINTIGTHPSYQRKGLALKLLENLILEANKAHMELISLEVRVSNTKAINLYQKLGFKIINTRKSYYEDNYEDAYEMIKEL